VLSESMSHPVQPEGVQPWVTKDDLPDHLGRRALDEDGPYVFPHALEHSDSMFIFSLPSNRQ